MTISSLRLLATAAAVTGGLAIASSSASAQVNCYPPSATCDPTPPSPVVVAGPTLRLSQTSVVGGEKVTASVTNFRPGTGGIITIASVEQQIGSFTASAAGTASTVVTIPTGLTLGQHTVFAKGTGLAGTAVVASQVVNVVAPGTRVTAADTGSTLARTGISVGVTALVGVGLVAGGVALKRSSRRGKASTKLA